MVGFASKLATGSCHALRTQTQPISNHLSGLTPSSQWFPGRSSGTISPYALEFMKNSFETRPIAVQYIQSVSRDALD